MPNVPGVDTALLAKVNLATEAAWSENQQQIETDDIQSTTFDKLVAKQKPLEAAFVTKLTDPEKEHDVKIYWPDFCNLTAVDSVTNVCNEIDSDMVSVKEKGYVINEAIETSFAINEDTLKTSSINIPQFITTNQSQAIKRLLQKLNLKSIAFLEANIGYNNGGAYPFSVGTYLSEVPAADYTVDLNNQIMYDMLASRVPRAFVLDGGKLYMPFTKAAQNAANGEGKGDATRAKLFDAEFDILGFASAGLSDRTYAVAPYAYAFLSKNYVPNRQPVYDEALGGGTGLWKYNIPLPKYGINVDVWLQRKCVDGNKNRFKIVWHYKINYEFVLNPTGCDQGDGKIVTGIMGYKRLPPVV